MYVPVKLQLAVLVAHVETLPGVTSTKLQPASTTFVLLRASRRTVPLVVFVVYAVMLRGVELDQAEKSVGIGTCTAMSYVWFVP